MEEAGSHSCRSIVLDYYYRSSIHFFLVALQSLFSLISPSLFVCLPPLSPREKKEPDRQKRVRVVMPQLSVIVMADDGAVV